MFYFLKMTTELREKKPKFYYADGFTHQISSSISLQVIKTHLEMHKKTNPSCLVSLEHDRCLKKSCNGINTMRKKN